MTDKTGTTPPFPGFPGFPPAEMLDRMWGMMRLSPFGSALSGAPQGGGLAPSLSMMSDMMAPLTNVEELDKRITDMRAVEQWLKLNLGMLQSAIQALEVQRATLATLRAFGAFAQSSMAQPAAAASGPAPSPAPAPATNPAPAPGWTQSAKPAPAPDSTAAAEGTASKEEEAPAAAPSFDASAWWNLLQSQFNQIAQFAMTQPATPAAAGGGTPDKTAATGAAAAPDAAAQGAKPTAKRPAAKRAAPAAKRAAGGSGAGSKKPL